jgi:hypothetical protein
VPRIVNTFARLAATSVTLDGEGVACDSDGVTNFELLRAAPGRPAKRSVPICLRPVGLDGHDLRREPWSDRRWSWRACGRGAGHGVQLSGSAREATTAMRCSARLRDGIGRHRRRAAISPTLRTLARLGQGQERMHRQSRVIER